MVETLSAYERLENALGELEAAEKDIRRAVCEERISTQMTVKSNMPYSEWMPLVTRDKLISARRATEAAIDALEIARAHVNELHRMREGDANWQNFP